MRLRFLATAVAVTATALTLAPVPTAQAAHDTCDGRKADIVGTSKSEKFTLTPEKRIINAHGGNDVIETFGLRPNRTDATVCMGSGDDTLTTGEDGPEAAPVMYLDGGKGFDTALIYACNTPRVYLRSMERVTIVNCAD
jgi:hypothetical protein